MSCPGFRKFTAAGLSLFVAALPAWAQGGAQNASIEPIRPTEPVIRSYVAPDVPPIRLKNSPRLASLIRSGMLYLTVQDAIALALENNIDLEIARYNPIIALWNLQRSEAGGALPGVPSGASQTAAVASGQGVAGSQAAAGVAGGGGRANAGGVGNASITQIGPVTQNLDPTFQQTAGFGHTSTPQVNATQSLTSNLLTNTKVFNDSIQKGFLVGSSATLSYADHYLNENAPSDLLNPSSAASLSFTYSQSLLRGFGAGVNARNIRVSKLNLNISDLDFKTQVIGTVVNVLNLYYSLVADRESVKAAQTALDAAQQFDRNTQRQYQLGTVAQLDVTTAGAQVATSRTNLVAAQTTLTQQELQMKNFLSRDGIADPMLRYAQIVPLDRIEVPENEELPSTADMVNTALANRPDLAAARISLQSAQISSLGTENGILPNLQSFTSLSNAGLSGTPHTVVARGRAENPDPYFVGGIGNALGQVLRRNFSTERESIFLQAPMRNRQAQADYALDQLSFRESQLTNQKAMNQVIVDVSNYSIALRQARARVETAEANQMLAQQLLEAEQKKFAEGLSASYNIVQEQQNEAAAASTAVAARAAYISARIALDQTLGTTLETNHVSLAEARSGEVGRTSSLPANLPEK